MLTIKKPTEIAVRLYDNPAYGTTYGKGLYRRAVYNGSIDTKSPTVKYVIDMYNYDDWSNQAKTDGQMEILNSVNQDKETLYSWIYRYDPISKIKTFVIGVCRLDLQTNEVDVMIADEIMDVFESWNVSAKPCKNKRIGVKAPTLLATNADLQNW